MARMDFAYEQKQQMKTTKNKRLINHKMTPASRERRAKDEGHSEPPNPDKGMSAFRQVTPLPVNHGKWTRHLNNADLFNSVTLAIRNGSNAIMDKMELIGGDKDADFEKFSIKYMNTKPTKQIEQTQLDAHSG